MLALCLSFAIVLLDQLTKHWVRAHFYPGQTTPVLDGLFNLSFVRNTGAAWGLLGGCNAWLVIVSLVMLALLVIFRKRFLNDTLVHRIALGLMVGGIVGNLCDRIKLQYVVDFLDFYWRQSHFPSFNVADSAICIGTGLYVLSSFFSPSHPLRGAVAGPPAKSGGPTASEPPAPT